MIVQLQTSAVVDLRWTDAEDGTVRTPAGDGIRQLELRRQFATLDEARGFEGTFEVVQDGNEVTRETVRFDACDRAQDYGLDPAGIAAVVFGRSFLDHWEAETHKNNRGPLGCYGTAASMVPNRDPQIYRAILDLPLAEGVATFEAGGPVVPASLQLWDDHALYVLHLDFPSSVPLTTTLTNLEVSLGGMPRGSVPVTFASCASADPAIFAEEEQWLKLPDSSDAGVTIDSNGGYFCNNRDGSGFVAMP